MSKFILSTNKTTIKELPKCVEVNNYYLNFTGLLHDFRNESGHGFILLGDCINPEALPPWDKMTVENEPKGNYYIFHISEHKIAIKSSGFAMHPVFYNKQANTVASNTKFIANQSKIELTFDKKWVVNQLLFNYQFGDTTVYEEIKLLQAFTILTIEGNNFHFNKVQEISDYFVEKPLKWQKQLKPLSKKFIDICEQYFPNQEFTISFTGGFDGRTQVSIAKFLKKTFSTFSYGRRNNDDVTIPKKNARELNIPYQWVPLEQEYVEKHYWQSAVDFIKQTNGGNGFLYAHVTHTAKKIGKQCKHSISGIASSELFRAVHITGAVTSPTLVQLFKSNSFEEFRNIVFNSSVFKYLDFSAYKATIEEVATECWEYRANLPSHLTQNQQLYVFVFNEIFRKFFGNWLLAQSDDLIVRTPFLDFQFFKELLKTKLAGVYSDFMTENPLKRYKGQVFYTEVIRQTSRKIFWQKTGKGYPPAFVRHAFLRPLLAMPFLLKRLTRNIKKPKLDNLAIISGIQYSFKNNTHIKLSNEFDFENLLSDVPNLTVNTPEQIRDNVLMYNSIAIYLQEQKKIKHI